MALARPGDPLVTDKGTVLMPTGRPIDAFGATSERVLGAPVAKKLTPSKQRTIKDLPIDEKTQTAINAVLVYVMLGLTDNEISHITHIPFEDIARLKNLDAYQETYDILFHEFIGHNNNSLQSKIAAFAGDALENVISLAKSANSDMTKLKADQDIMDRAGLHPETLFGKNKQDDGFDSLKIVISDGDDTSHKVDINVTRK